MHVGEPDPKILLNKALRGAKWRDNKLQLKRSRWLTREWTLQEFIASRSISFYDRDWNRVGSLCTLRDELAEVIGIPRSICAFNGIDIKEFGKTNLQERISWARNRYTTRPEDRAYSLLGLLNVSMPMICGEGVVHAFKRLNREVKEEHGVELNLEDLY